MVCCSKTILIASVISWNGYDISIITPLRREFPVPPSSLCTIEPLCKLLIRIIYGVIPNVVGADMDSVGKVAAAYPVIVPDIVTDDTRPLVKTAVPTAPVPVAPAPPTGAPTGDPKQGGGRKTRHRRRRSPRRHCK